MHKVRREEEQVLSVRQGLIGQKQFIKSFIGFRERILQFHTNEHFKDPKPAEVMTSIPSCTTKLNLGTVIIKL